MVVSSFDKRLNCWFLKFGFLGDVAYENSDGDLEAAAAFVFLDCLNDGVVAMEFLYGSESSWL